MQVQSAMQSENLSTSGSRFMGAMRARVELLCAERQATAADRQGPRPALSGERRADALRRLWSTWPGLAARL